MCSEQDCAGRGRRLGRGSGSFPNDFAGSRGLGETSERCAEVGDLSVRTNLQPLARVCNIRWCRNLGGLWGGSGLAGVISAGSSSASVESVMVFGVDVGSCVAKVATLTFVCRRPGVSAW